MSTSPNIRIFADRQILAESLAKEFSDLVNRLAREKEQVNIALSGGSTPSLFFRAMVALEPEIDWGNIRFYWVDERCVPPDHPESNFGVAYREFLAPMNVPEDAYFRIRGENDPAEEAKRYDALIHEQVGTDAAIPAFDIIFLGMGADGHTASIFPDQSQLWNEPQLCTVGVHPETGQHRVTFTGRLINAAARVSFMVTGQEKAAIVQKVVTRTGNYADYPASLVAPYQGQLEWFLDKAAGSTVG